MKRKPRSRGERPTNRARTQAIRLLEHACSSSSQSITCAREFLGGTKAAARLAYDAESVLDYVKGCWLAVGEERSESQAEAALWLAEGWHP